MKIQKINAFFRKVGEFQIRYRWPLMIFALLLTIFGIFGLQKMHIANARDDWFDDKEAIEIATEEFEDQFGNNDNISILIEADDVFAPEVLTMMKNIGQELVDSVPYADEITSLVDMEISVGTEEGIEVINPFEDSIPTNLERLEKIRQLVLSRKAMKGKVVSEDCTETWLTLSLLEYPEKEEWEKVTDKDPMFQSGEVAIRIITNPKWKSDKYTLKPAGTPYTETEERDFFGAEMIKRFLSAFIAMIILLVLFIRSFRGVIVPSVTTILGVIVVFGGMGWLGIGIDQNMTMLPMILGMALSVGYSIHLINAFKRIFRKTGKRKEAVIKAVEETGWPVFFTAITTIGSVLSFVTAGIMTIAWVGYACAAFVLIDYLFVIILIPILMSFGKDKAIKEEDISKIPLFEKWMENIGQFVLKKKVAVLIFFAACIVVIAPGIRGVTTNMDIFEFMGTKVPYVKRVYDVTQSQLGSYLTYNITVKFDEPDAIKGPEVLRKFDALLDTVSAFELTKKNKNAATVFSILDIIKEMNQTLHSDSAKHHTIPGNSDMIAQVLLLYEMSGGTKTFNWIDEDYSMLRAQVQVEKFATGEIVRELDAIKRIGNESFDGATVNYVGSAVQFAELNRKIVTGELKSVIWALIIIGLLLVIVFSSIKTGLIGLIPNFMPLVVIGGYMGHFNSPLDMMTMTILPMLLGIAVDDTIHFINAIKFEFEKCGNYNKAIIAAFHTVGKNITMTTIILCASFAMFTLSPVANMVRIGYLAPMGLLAALIADFFVTPALISLTKPFGKERDRSVK
ncbi:MAG: efflux RND transporter permease subunit [Draconibacterium sp.]